MKAMTVRRPWSFAIAQLGKDIENRPRNWRYRGELAIHAGLGWDDVALGPIRRFTGVQTAELIRSTPRGVVAVADLVGCHQATIGLVGATCCTSPWGMVNPLRHVWHLELANVRQVAVPVPCRGALGLWTLPADVEAAVREQLVDVEVAG
jgi:hypothetical protein